MLITCWSVKGGSGTTVVASSLALLLAERSVDTCLVDLGGDVPAALGLTEPDGPGIGDWLGAATISSAREPNPSTVGSSLAALELHVAPSLAVLPLGHRCCSPLDSWSTLAAHFASHPRTYIVDGGTVALPPILRSLALHDYLVVRGCYLALRRAVNLSPRPSGVVHIAEPLRVLRTPEIEGACGVPVVAEIPWEPSVCRSVDSGQLRSRMPAALRLGLEALPCMP
jgi:hypothetical protein